MVLCLILIPQEKYRSPERHLKSDLTNPVATQHKPRLCLITTFILVLFHPFCQMHPRKAAMVGLRYSKGKMVVVANRIFKAVIRISQLNDLVKENDKG